MEVFGSGEDVRVHFFGGFLIVVVDGREEVWDFTTLRYYHPLYRVFFGK